MMLNRKIKSVLALTLVAGTRSAATAFAAEANTFNFQPAAPVSHSTQRLDENATISGNDMFDFTVAEVDGCAANWTYKNTPRQSRTSEKDKQLMVNL